MKVTLFNSRYDTKTGSEVSIDKLIDAQLKGVFTTDKDEAMGFTPYCTFTEGRSISNVNETTGILSFDYDEEKNFDASERIQKLLKSKLGDYLFWSFASHSGGTKFLIKTDLHTTNGDEYRFKYKKIQSKLEKLLDIKLDDATCDLSRLVLLTPYQPHINKESKVMKIGDLGWSEHLVQLQKEDEKFFKRQKKMLESHTVNEQKQAIANEKALQDYYNNHNTAGQRHYGIFILGTRLMSNGCTDSEVAMFFKRLGSAYTEDMSPLNKAKDIRKKWNGKMNKFVFTQNTALSKYADLL